MSFNPTTPITGAAQAGFTAPTYTLTDDVAPDINGKQKAITALGGTQAGVIAHSVAAPFTMTFIRPRVFKTLGQPNPVTGRIANVPKNRYKLLVRKGVLPLAGQPYQVADVDISMNIPAGSDLADAANLKAMLSCAFGAAFQVASGVGDTVTTGVM